MAESNDGVHVTVVAKWDTNVAPLMTPMGETKPVSVEFASVYTVHDGKLARAQNMYDVSQFAIALGTLQKTQP